MRRAATIGATLVALAACKSPHADPDAAFLEDGGAIDGGSLDVPECAHDGESDVPWARCGGGHMGHLAFGAAWDREGGAWVTGVVTPGAVLADRDLAVSGISDVLLARFDARGRLAVVRTVGGIANAVDGMWETGQRVAVDATGEVYVAGRYAGEADFGRGVVAPSGRNLFVARFAAEGEVRWVRIGSGEDSPDVRTLVVGASGEVYVTGILNARFGRMGPFQTQSFATRFDPDGYEPWLLGSDWEGGLGVETQSAHLLSSGDVLWSGSSGGPGPAEVGGVTIPPGPFWAVVSPDGAIRRIGAGTAVLAVRAIDATRAYAIVEHPGASFDGVTIATEMRAFARLTLGPDGHVIEGVPFGPASTSSGGALPSETRVAIGADGGAVFAFRYAGAVALDPSTTLASGGVSSVVARYAPDGSLVAHEGPWDVLVPHDVIADDATGEVVVVGEYWAETTIFGRPLAPVGEPLSSIPDLFVARGRVE